uniref:CSON013175 protein n=1 Tax=Culicoides sonorensis TaxID=179676 RepID=A0A336MBK5_CULSO
MTNSLYYIFVLIFMFHECQRITAYNQVTIAVPTIIDVRDFASISCNYNIGFHKLISVKWYKDNKEFYRYTPFNAPSETRMTVKGVKISERHNIVCDERACRIVLQNLSAQSSGIYKCEIAGEAPTFQVVQNQANMTVLVLPKRDPHILGLQLNRYRFGEVVNANCTSDVSSLPVNLQWYINDQKAPQAFVKQPVQITNNLEGFQLQYKISELTFKIEKSRFHDTRGQIKLQCVAKIERLPSTAQPVIRETSTYINLVSRGDELKNQKLIDSGATTNAIKNILTTILMISLTLMMQ